MKLLTFAHIAAHLIQEKMSILHSKSQNRLKKSLTIVLHGLHIRFQGSFKSNEMPLKMDKYMNRKKKLCLHNIAQQRRH